MSLRRRLRHAVARALKRSHERGTIPAGTSLAAETDAARSEEPAESRLQPGLAAPQSMRVSGRRPIAGCCALAGEPIDAMLTTAPGWIASVHKILRRESSWAKNACGGLGGRRSSMAHGAPAGPMRAAFTIA
jgi:hypothetical protein